MRFFTSTAIITSVGLLVGCAATLPPQELISARQAYSHASATPSSRHVLVELKIAHDALVRAEASFLADPTSSMPRTLADIAYREAKSAETLGAKAAHNSISVRASEFVQTLQTGDGKQQ